MRILVLTHEYPPIGGGGGRVARDLCTRLALRGHEIRILTAKTKDLSDLRDDEELFKVIRLASCRREVFRADIKALLGYVLTSFWEGMHQIQTWKPDVIHVHFAVPAGASAYLLNLLTKVPYVITAHLGDVPGGVPEKTEKWFRWVFPMTPRIWKRAANIAAVSEHTRSLALKSYDVPISVIHNGVELSQLDPGEINLHDPVQIVFAGRFAEQKNLYQIVNTLNMIKDLDWVCTLMGDGPLFDPIKAEIDKNHLGNKISLTGWVTPEKVIEEFKNSDILFMPSFSEGLPVVGVQGLSMGLALVMSRIGGCIDLVNENENGKLVLPSDTQGFANALKELILEPEKLMRFRKNSRLIAQKFSLEYISNQYEDLLHRSIEK
jgi:glycosyltransferase involved in cell wall biosynthesis